MHSKSVAILVYGDDQSTRNALTEEKYKDLAEAFVAAGFQIDSVLYNDEKADQLSGELSGYGAVLVWINPIEKGRDRKRLDTLLTEVADKGCFVSTHPSVILKIGTKEVLYATKDMEWGGDTKMYTSFEEFKRQFPDRLKTSGVVVLKRYRGNGGNGVYKIIINENDSSLTVIHAIAGDKPEHLSFDELFEVFKSFFSNDGLLIEQEWNPNTVNGMVRCYVSGTSVCGFGYQEVNALYETNQQDQQYFVPSKRYYFSERCGLFSDLKHSMENKWIGELQNRFSIPGDKMPVIWDADFFINQIDGKSDIKKYTLCEINVSSVSPFPPGSIPFIVKRLEQMLLKK